MVSNFFRYPAVGIAVFVLFNCGRTGPKDYPIRPVSFTQVHVDDRFWAPRMETNRTVTIPHAFRMCEKEGRLDNFAIAAGLREGEHRGYYPFDDTDVYKTLEGASYALMLHPDPGLETYLDSVIALIAAAQEPDGYLYTVRTNGAGRLKRWFGDERWEKLESSHELYNAGHLFEAASAHFQATGRRNLLDVAVRFADLIDSTFGAGKLRKPPGHQVVEMGLARLYRVTGNPRYIQLAKYFLDIRGRTMDGRELRGEYNQDHRPVVEQDEAVGHAVRAGYMYAGMADVAALTGDTTYIGAIDRLWENVAGRKLYLTGGVGATGSNEGFSGNYDLPNMSAYNETCASIANIYWNHKQFLLHGDARYLDVMERTLYNAFLSGVSLDGTRFFYPNPLESAGQHERSEWFGCACCPGNVTRFVASIPGYMYGIREDNLYVALYAAGEADVTVGDQRVQVIQETRYPWDGRVRIRIVPEKPGKRFTVWIRIPGWARGRPLDTDLYRYLDAAPADVTLALNGHPVALHMERGFARIRNAWKLGDEIDLFLPMPVRRVLAHDSVAADRGRVALERGPLVYCAEWPDNPEGYVRNLLFSDETPLSTRFEPDLLQGVQIIQGEARAFRRNERGDTLSVVQPITAIPYYAWAHRGRGEMAVWLARDPEAVRPAGMPTLASMSEVTASFGKNPHAVNDLLEPSSSIDHDVPFFHWWPHKGTREWIQYTFSKPEEVSMTEVYWFDDTGRGECRLPASWRILYREGGKWKPVWTPDTWGIEKDRYNRVVFETVRTEAVRLEVQSRAGWACGVHEWRIR
jgi:DUF1680 family protein